VIRETTLHCDTTTDITTPSFGIISKKILFRGRTQAKASKTTTSLYHSGPFATVRKQTIISLQSDQ
jgi:hypothetical protein